MATIHHTGITVSDLDRSSAFYREAFGCVEAFRHELSGPDFARAVGVPGASLRVVALAADNGLVELLQYVAPDGRPFDRANNDVGAAHVCFEVDDIDAAYDRLVALGASGVARPNPADEDGPGAGTRFAYLRDPDGITVELLQPGPTLRHAALGVGAAK